jgi:hypothetical protein
MESELLRTAWLERCGQWSGRGSWEPHGTRGSLYCEVAKAYTISETLVSTHKLEEAIEMHFSDFLPHTMIVCKDMSFVQRVSNCNG